LRRDFSNSRRCAVAAANRPRRPAHLVLVNASCFMPGFISTTAKKAAAAVLSRHRIRWLSCAVYF
jgi:hypothetical protein